MTEVTLRTFKQKLFDIYGGFSDKRLKNIDGGSTFIVDDRNPSDNDARGKLFLWFCHILLDVDDLEAVEISLRGGVPSSPAVEAWLKANTVPGRYNSPAIRVARGEQGKLLELAGLFDAIVARGKRYDVAAYKYVCPRTSSSLSRLKDALDRAWGGDGKKDAA